MRYYMFCRCKDNKKNLTVAKQIEESTIFMLFFTNKLHISLYFTETITIHLKKSK